MKETEIRINELERQLAWAMERYGDYWETMKQWPQFEYVFERVAELEEEK